ncbi:multiple epidermal growth factor-like domains protein 11 isoform X1 [Crassostrea angulata]|uniref:multiple epidermal growth factor-like domains protein 11 isoform X1 n=1 Tax=Magallana angulata TaxID=2784310 RepID=UPI0022B0AC15|nr:multiple epidermal growth factor-like domains protein 11 isoform X1 [Crassostrea angulata]
MMSMSGNSVCPHDVLTVLFCLLTASQAYVNVALNKPAYQQYPNENDRYDASNAVDGRKSDLGQYGGQCAVSQNRQTATWWVNLTTIHSIHHITIYFMTNYKPFGPSNDITKYFLGFSVYVSNTTARLQGTLCYKDDNFTLDTIPAVFTTTCPVHGQYVIYYNERLSGVTYPRGYSDRVSTDLCEVEVFGCPATGYFGSNCSVPCSDVNCQYCHIESGTCQGCKPGYKGHRCEMVCEGGTYGAGCKETCGTCRDVNQCSINNGTCLTGCDAGFKGDLCKTVCDRGSYGYVCNETCGHCRDVNRCSIFIGTCLTGCDAGYQGDLCKKSCDSGSYGYDCNEICGHCRDVNKCSIINGTCLTGCDVDYQGNLCKTLCPVGYFGQDCSETCINSYTCDGCNDVSGSCEYGCRPGWIGYFCQKSIYFFQTHFNLILKCKL